MILGVDFDNTLACYSGLFHAEAVLRGLIPAASPVHKQGVRDVLRAKGRDADFTLLQGQIYGPGILAAPVYEDAVQTLESLKAQGAIIYIISHKTRFPYLGPKHDLHEFANRWLEERGFYREDLLPPSHVFLEQSKESKLRRIAELGCTHFVDDLPEILTHPDFPRGTEPLLFAPDDEGQTVALPSNVFPTFTTWKALSAHLHGLLCKIQHKGAKVGCCG